ncbi:MAG: thioredoxin family protein [Woeseiaceae bacterium]
MAATESRMLELGTLAPDFTLPDAKGTSHSLSDAAGSSACLVMFICNHCPFVKHVRRELARLGRDCAARNVAVFAINSNDAVTYPADNPERMLEESAALGYTFPYLVDADQSVAKAYRAACTPDFFLFDGDLRLAYRGQLDASRPSNGIEVSGADLRAALDAVLAGRKPDGDQKPSIGCNIKWKAGNEPDWYR